MLITTFRHRDWSLKQLTGLVYAKQLDENDWKSRSNHQRTQKIQGKGITNKLTRKTVPWAVHYFPRKANFC